MTVHVVFAPEWVIEANGNGSFRVECDCGWEASGFDTASSARTASFEHTTSARAGDGATATPAAPDTKPKRGLFRRRASR